MSCKGSAFFFITKYWQENLQASEFYIIFAGLLTSIYVNI